MKGLRRKQRMGSRGSVVQHDRFLCHCKVLPAPMCTGQLRWYFVQRHGVRPDKFPLPPFPSPGFLMEAPVHA